MGEGQREREREREEERESQAGSTLSAKSPTRGSNPRNCEITTLVWWAETKSWTLNQVSHPGAQSFLPFTHISMNSLSTFYVPGSVLGTGNPNTSGPCPGHPHHLARIYILKGQERDVWVEYESKILPGREIKEGFKIQAEGPVWAKKQEWVDITGLGTCIPTYRKHPWCIDNLPFPKASNFFHI